MRLLSRWGCAWLAVLMGCQSQTATKPTDAEATAKPTAAASKPAESADSAAHKHSHGLRLRSNVTSFPGNWLLVITQQENAPAGKAVFRDLHLVLLEFKEGAAGFEAAVLDAMPMPQSQRPEFSVRDFQVDGAKCQFALRANENTLRFQGKLENNIARGSVSDANGTVSPAILRPTLETKYDVEAWDPAPQSPGAEIIGRAVQQKNVFAGILNAAKELRGHPLALEAYGGVFARLGMFPDVSEADVRKAAKNYIADSAMWGDPLVAQARLNVAVATASSRKFPQVALEWLDEAEQAVDAETKAMIADTWSTARSQVQVDLALAALKTDAPEEQSKGYAALQEQLTRHRFNPEVLAALGQYAAGHEQPDKAIEYFGDIIALPLLEGTWAQSRAGQPPGDPTPRQRLLQLWEEKHGNLDGFEAFLEGAYHQRMAQLAEEIHAATPKPETTGSHAVLVELFTGAFCGPCVSADVALEIIESDFPAPHVIAIRYHQHIPGPDPLANQDSEDRYGYYQGQGTPNAIIDGGALPPPGVGGYLQHVGRAYAMYRASIAERLKTENGVQLAVTAHAANAELTVSSEATGWPAEKSKKLRLRMALVEQMIAFPAPNGIRTHQHVVRELIGGSKGVGVKAGKLATTVTVPLAEFRQRLVDYLQQFESNRRFKFPVKPLALAPLAVVAWVQDDETHEILHTVLAPVVGDVTIPGLAPENPAPTPEEAASALDPANKAAP